jgi:hypothetical protein
MPPSKARGRSASGRTTRRKSRTASNDFEHLLERAAKYFKARQRKTESARKK